MKQIRISAVGLCHANQYTTNTWKVRLCYYNTYLILNSWSITLLAFHLPGAMPHTFCAYLDPFLRIGQTPQGTKATLTTRE